MSLKITVGMMLHARHPMFLWWGPELVQFYNDAFLPSLGSGKHPAAMGQRGKECWGEVWPIIWPQIDDVMSRGKPSWNEDALVPILRNGRLEDVWWTFGFSPVFDDQGRIGGTLVVCTETTGRVLAERAQKEMVDSLAITLNSIGESVLSTDSAGAIIRMNAAAEELTGWTLAEARGKHLPDTFKILVESTREEIDVLGAKALLKGGAPIRGPRAILVRRDGTEVPIVETCAPIRSATGSVEGAVIVFRDRTAERDAAAVEEKYQRHLVFSDRMSSVGTLAAGVAHEINNPLTYVKANIDSALEEIREFSGGSPSGRMKDLEQLLAEAGEGAARIAKIVRDMKTFSRVDEERFGVVDLHPVIELSLSMASNEIRHRARLVKEYGRVPLVDADEARLGQVFINLLVNAAQALPEGGTNLNEIRVRTSTDENGNAVVEVHDSGPGIPTAVISRIFDPFFTTKPVGVGTGLGLSICHNIVAAIGGQITVASEIGKGTTFRVVLPPSSSLAQVPAAPLERSIATDRRPANVLVVDDEPIVGAAVRRVLGRETVTVVTTAHEALSLVESGTQFDVILCDLMMPGMSGMQLHAALAKLHPGVADRIVFMTGGAFTSDAKAFLDGVANERMDKPFETIELRRLVDRFVK